MQFGEYDFRTFTFGKGKHSSRAEGMCVMEAVAYVAGERHSDHPECACPVISAFLRDWNDGIASDARRTELLSPFVFRLPGTRSTKEIEDKRSWMAFDWLVREYLPSFLELEDELKPHAESLRGLPEISQKNCRLAVLTLNAAKASTGAGAAWDAACDAVAAAGGDAAWKAAGKAVGAAVRKPVGNAAWAARYAGGDALRPTVEKLQQSVVELVDRMIRLTEPQETVPVRRTEHATT